MLRNTLQAWVCHRIGEVIGQLSTVLDDEQLEAVVKVCKGNGLL